MTINVDLLITKLNALCLSLKAKPGKQLQFEFSSWIYPHREILSKTQMEALVKKLQDAVRLENNTARDEAIKPLLKEAKKILEELLKGTKTEREVATELAKIYHECGFSDYQSLVHPSAELVRDLQHKNSELSRELNAKNRTIIDLQRRNAELEQQLKKLAASSLISNERGSQDSQDLAPRLQM